MPRQQSAADRRKRLGEGRCPVHGIFMPQVGGWSRRVGGALDGKQVTIVECPRRDCSIQAYAAAPDGPWELLPEHDWLLAGE